MKNPFQAHTALCTSEHQSMEAMSIHKVHTEPKPLSTSDTVRTHKKSELREKGQLPKKFSLLSKPKPLGNTMFHQHKSNTKDLSCCFPSPDAAIGSASSTPLLAPSSPTFYLFFQ